MGGDVCRRQPQIGPEDHPPQTGVGVPFCFGGVQNGGKGGGLPAGLVQPLANALPAGIQHVKLRRAHGAEPG